MSAWFYRVYIRRRGLTRHKLTLYPANWKGWAFLAGWAMSLMAVLFVGTAMFDRNSNSAFVFFIGTLLAGLAFLFVMGVWKSEKREWSEENNDA